jgi:hypothetical protein
MGTNFGDDIHLPKQVNEFMQSRDHKRFLSNLTNFMELSPPWEAASYAATQ